MGRSRQHRTTEIGDARLDPRISESGGYSLLTISMISARIFFGTAMPFHPRTS
jgi:hypothetical protein